ncbi:MAG: glutathione S-transferase family protein [Pseudomonadota bacterium]|nr:glutathione S-transferase family protein [Pseudomonadota bacterium]
MKLVYSGNSPYARRPRIAIREAGLLDKIEEVNVAPMPDNMDQILGFGPGAKVPGLVTNSGTYICETLAICNYLDGVTGGRLYPKEGAARDRAFEIEGIASLLMDSLFARSHEKRREDGEKSQGVIDKEANRAQRSYDTLEGMVDSFGDDFHMGLMSVAASLGYADWRHPDDNWRDGRPKLAAWYAAMENRSAVDETKVVL